MTLEATIGGLTFIGDDRAATYTLDTNGLDGWFAGGTTMRREYVDRPNGHGQFPMPGYLSGRIVTLRGKVLADSPAGFEAALEALEGLLADGLEDTLTVVTTVGTSTLSVSRYGAVDTKILVYGQLAEYQIQLWAPNPDRT